MKTLSIIIIYHVLSEELFIHVREIVNRKNKTKKPGWGSNESCFSIVNWNVITFFHFSVESISFTVKAKVDNL